MLQILLQLYCDDGGSASMKMSLGEGGARSRKLAVGAAVVVAIATGVAMAGMVATRHRRAH